MTETNIALQKSLQHTNVPSAHGGAASAKINPKNAGTKDSVSTRAGARKDGGTRGTKRGREDVCFFSFAIVSLIFLWLILWSFGLGRRRVTRSLKWSWICRRFWKSFSSMIGRPWQNTTRSVRFSISPTSNSTHTSHHFFIQLVTLPRSPNVVELLTEFAEYIKTTKPPQFVQPLFKKALNLTFFVHPFFVHHHQSERTSFNDPNRRLRTSNLLWSSPRH